MSRLRSSHVVAALGGTGADIPTQARQLADRLRDEASPRRVAKALVAPCAESRPPGGTFWVAVTGGAGLIAGAAAWFGLSRLAAMLGADGRAVSIVPLAGVLLAMAAGLSVFRLRRYRERRSSDQLLVAVSRGLLAAGVSGPNALETAAYVAGVSPRRAARRFNADDLAVSLALSAPRDGPSWWERVPTILAGAAAIWSVMSYWIGYILLLGGAADRGVW